MIRHRDLGLGICIAAIHVRSISSTPSRRRSVRCRARPGSYVAQIFCCTLTPANASSSVFSSLIARSPAATLAFEALRSDSFSSRFLTSYHHHHHHVRRRRRRPDVRLWRWTAYADFDCLSHSHSVPKPPTPPAGAKLNKHSCVITQDKVRPAPRAACAGP